MANADSTAGSHVRANQKRESYLSDRAMDLITKSHGICGVFRQLEGVKESDTVNAMWAAQDMLDEANKIVEELHDLYNELKNSSPKLAEGERHE